MARRSFPNPAVTQTQHKAVPYTIELIQFYALLFLAVLTTYRLTGFNNMFFGILLLAAAFSGRGYFWIAFFFVILNTPARVFEYSSFSHTLPLLRPLPGISLTIVDMFLVIMLVKVISKKKRYNITLRTPLIFLVFYFVFSWIRGALLFSESFDRPIVFIRPCVYYSWILVFVAYVDNREKVLRLVRLIFPLTFFILFTQIYHYATNKEFFGILSPDHLPQAILLEMGLPRLVEKGGLLVFLNFIGASLVLQREPREEGRKYLYAVVGLSYFSAFISATRLFFVLFTITGVGIYFSKTKDIHKLVLIVLIVLITVVSLLKFEVLDIGYLTDNVWGRLAFGVGSFIQGRGGQVETYASRLEKLRIMQPYIRQNLLFGLGFSESAMENFEGHWGFYTTLYFFGICGQILFILLIVAYFKMILSRRRLSPDSNINNFSRVLTAGFIGMLILYVTNWNFFSLVYASRVMFLMIFFGISEILTRPDSE